VHVCLCAQEGEIVLRESESGKKKREEHTAQKDTITETERASERECVRACVYVCVLCACKRERMFFSGESCVCENIFFLLSCIDETFGRNAKTKLKMAQNEAKERAGKRGRKREGNAEEERKREKERMRKRERGNNRPRERETYRQRERKVEREKERMCVGENTLSTLQ